MSSLSGIKSNLEPRTEDVLFATIAEYISTGVAVSSKTLAKKQHLKMSPATIRRELKKLAEKGYLIQPHTSAGRVPTDRAFRLFADKLKQETSLVDTSKRERLLSALGSSVPPGHGTWKETVHLLSELSDQAALVITPALSDAILRQLRFIPCGATSLLAVIVTREGLVYNNYVKSREQLTSADLDRFHNYLNELIEGRSLNEVRRLLRAELEDARKRCDALREKASLLGSEALQSTERQTSEILVEGRSHLLAQPDLKNRLEQLLEFLEEKTQVLDLLDSAAKTDAGPLIIIGKEGGEGFEGCAMITSPFGDESSKGQVGVVGSVRMDYSAVIPLVALAAQYLSSRIKLPED